MREYQQKYGNNRRENHGRKEWESIKRKRIVGGNYGGKNGRVSEGWEFLGENLREERREIKEGT